MEGIEENVWIKVLALYVEEVDQVSQFVAFDKGLKFPVRVLALLRL